ncbi:MAG: hypothetical protein DU430_05595 [Candidatus Tokpelaia sp.]|nr:MAG: hypothetical protein DU430_05595 [Candidatus Tokpelaia sp.]
MDSALFVNRFSKEISLKKLKNLVSFPAILFLPACRRADNFAAALPAKKALIKQIPGRAASAAPVNAALIYSGSPGCCGADSSRVSEAGRFLTKQNYNIDRLRGIAEHKPAQAKAAFAVDYGWRGLSGANCHRQHWRSKGFCNALICSIMPPLFLRRA